jgi:hypothetical protein
VVYLVLALVVYAGMHYLEERLRTPGQEPTNASSRSARKQVA